MAAAWRRKSTRPLYSGAKGGWLRRYRAGLRRHGDLAQQLTRELQVPVIDGVSAAVKMVESLVSLGLTTSKHGDLAYPERKTLSGKFAVFND